MSELREILCDFCCEGDNQRICTVGCGALAKAEQSIRSHFEAKVGECRVLSMSDLYGGEIIDKSDIIARIWEESK